MKPIVRVCLAVSFLSLLLVLNYVSIVKASSSDRDTAKYLLDRILDTRKKVNNFKCTVVYHNYRPKEARQKQIEQLIRQGAPKKIVNRLASRTHEHNEYRFSKHQLAFDNDGRARVQMVGGISDAKGKLMKVTSKQISTWDGESAIQYYERPEGESSSAILSEKQPFETTKRIRQPWQQFGGDFYVRFARAISDGTQINAVKEKDGKYRVELIFEKDRKQIAIVDPSQGYSPTLQENYSGGQLRERYTAKFMEVSPNVWFPSEGEDISFSMDDPTLLRLKSTIKVSVVTINDPNFYENLFHVDFPKGTRVIDAISGIQYTVGEPMSKKVYVIANTDKAIIDQQIPSLGGKPLPELKDLKIDLSPADADNKTILACFFDMEQRPSRNCIMRLARQAQQFKQKGVTVVAVQASKIDGKALNQWVKKYKIPFPVGMVQGDEEKARFAWGIRSLPWLILTDNEHTVRAEGFSLAEMDDKIKEINDAEE